MDDEEQRIFRQSTLLVFLKGSLKVFEPESDNNIIKLREAIQIQADQKEGRQRVLLQETFSP